MMAENSRIQKKLSANEFGKFAEEVTAGEYIKRGYTVLEREWKLGKTEIDIIAQKEDTIVLVEVKARENGIREAMDAVSADKRRRMIRAADAYIRKLPGNLSYRFDIAACAGNIQNYRLEIFEDAFLATDLF